MSEFLQFFLHLEQYIEQLAGSQPMLTYFLLFAIVYVESAFFPAAPFLPGDGLLFIVGVLAAGGILHLWIPIPVLIAGGFLGNLSAYWAGAKLGPGMFNKYRWLNKSHYRKAYKFYNRYGQRAMFVSRFVPVVRALVPLIAGIANMNKRRFNLYNILSVGFWVLTITIASYFLGQHAWIRAHFTWIVFGMVGVSFLPMVYLFLKKMILGFRGPG